MTILTRLFQVFIALLSLTTATGVLVHDTHVDIVATNVIGRSPLASYAESQEAALREPATEIRAQHVHVDYNPANGGFLSQFVYQSPSIPPRGQDQKRHLLQEVQTRGHHPFDNYNLPVIS